MANQDKDLLKAERLAAVEQTVSAVMHEIKNIIQLAKFSDEYLRMGIQSKNEQHMAKGVEGIGKALHDMDGFISEMLSLSKNYRIALQKMKVQDLLLELQKDVQRRAEEFHVALDFQAEEPMPEVEGDPRSLKGALLNLVKNAIEARKSEGAYVRIKARSRDEAHYEIAVEDNGLGMTDEVKANLFQPFYSTKGEHGTGLGLMVVERTVKAHRGEIQFESEVGKGTRFTLTFPKTLTP